MTLRSGALSTVLHCLTILLVGTSVASAEVGTPECTAIVVGDNAAVGDSDAAGGTHAQDDASGAVRIGRIYVRAGDLFDSTRRAEGRFVHGAANALHVATRQATILDALPFKRGDEFVAGDLAEAERILRAKRYLRSASVVPVRRCGDVVDIEVRTVDNWTLTPSVSFSSAGGVERYSVELQDLNVLGTGKELKFARSEAGVERETVFIYGDDNVLGGHHRLRLELGETETGELFGLSTGLPFYSADAERGWWLDVRRANDSFGLEELGMAGAMVTTTAGAGSAEELNDATVETTLVDAGVARRLEGSDADIARIGTGLRYERQHSQLPQGSTMSAFDVGDVDEIYPYVYAQWARSSWTKQTNFRGLGRVEDIDTGLGVRVEAGLLLDAFGNDRDAVRLQTTIGRGWWTSPASVHTLSLEQTSYIDGQSTERFELGTRYQYFRWITVRDHLDLRVVADRQSGRSPAFDFELGGEYGLKGYPNGYQRGDTRLLAVAEFRHVTDWSPFSLVNLGWGVFAEAGRAWRGSDSGTADTLADVGAGLLFSPSRSSRNEILRLDVTFPLVDGEGVDDFLIFAGSQLNF